MLLSRDVLQRLILLVQVIARMVLEKLSLSVKDTRVS